MSIEETVLNIIAKEQHLDREKVAMDSTFEELGIDSLDGVNIMFALEEEFDVSIPDAVARQAKSVRNVVEDLTRFLENPEAFKAELAATMPVKPAAGKPPGEAQ